MQRDRMMPIFPSTIRDVKCCRESAAVLLLGVVPRRRRLSRLLSPAAAVVHHRCQTKAAAPIFSLYYDC
jgi:hypothetical protein